MARKTKTQQEKLIDGIKFMHPVYVAYLIQRIEYDTKELIKAIPSIYEKDAKDMKEGKIGLFSPDFYVTYANGLLEIFDDVHETKTDRVEYMEKGNSVFNDTEK